MSQEELFNHIKDLGNKIAENRILNQNNPIYTVDKNKILEWFREIRNFTANVDSEDLKERLEIFINESQSCLNRESSVINENIFERIRQSFRICFMDTNYFWEN